MPALRDPLVQRIKSQADSECILCVRMAMASKAKTVEQLYGRGTRLHTEMYSDTQIMSMLVPILLFSSLFHRS